VLGGLLMENRKVVIIGDGAVGSTTAYTLMMQHYVNEIAIIDLNKEKVEGDVLDMVHGVSFVTPKVIKAGTYEDVKDAHIIVITAGVGQKEGETRLDLLKRNIRVFDSIIEQIKPNLSKDAIVLASEHDVMLIDRDVLTNLVGKYMPKINIDGKKYIATNELEKQKIQQKYKYWI
jgi:L-lactate dehydrogenase